jgi:hypothetical protein
MSIVSALKTYIATCPHLEALAPIHVDELGQDVCNYSIDPLAGAIIVSEDILGNTKREFPFALSSKEYTVDDLTRIDNNGFYQDFTSWMESQTKSKVFPTLGAKQTATKIEATSWGYLFGREADAQSGVYQINCKLYYNEEV